MQKKSPQVNELLTRREYLVLARHIQRDIEYGADGSFSKYDPETGAHFFDEREAQIVEKALRKIREHLLAIERRS
jgi:hypothetical protein